jgi:hypothetical protein
MTVCFLYAPWYIGTSEEPQNKVTRQQLDGSAGYRTLSIRTLPDAASCTFY